MSDLIIDSTMEDDGTGVIIDVATGDQSTDRVDLSRLTAPRSIHQPKTKFTHEQDLSKTGARKITVSKKTSNSHPVIPEVPKATRKEVTIDAIAMEEEPKDPSEIHISPLLDIVDPSNPNSQFSQYVKQKEEEAREWIAERQEAIALEQEEKALNIDATSESGEIGGVDANQEHNWSNNRTAVLDDDLDISGLLDDEETEEGNEMTTDEMILEDSDTGEVEEVDALIDKEDLPFAPDEEEEEAPISDEEEAVEEVIEEDEDDDEPTVTIGKIDGVTDNKVVEEEVDGSDIDLDSDIDSSFEMVDIEEEKEEDPATTVAPADNNEVLKNLQKLATEKLKPVSKKLDISSFTVLKKPSANINPIFQESSARVVKWVLPAQESTVLMKEFSGAELEKLREYSENGRSVDSLNRRYNMIYEHIVSPKPATFEQWLKTTPFEDVDHYFFAIYMASFKGANYLPMDCPNKQCGETFITDDISIMEMVKFDNKEAKAKFTELYQSETTPAGKGVYCSEIVPLSNKVAIGFRQPSIYNIFEIATMDDRTRSAYSSFLEYVPFIDELYMIDEVNQQIVPIGYKTFADNAQKTVRSKIMKYDQVFSSLSVDEFGVVKAYIRALTEKVTGIRYVYPSVECPKCHKPTEEIPASGEELVFTRYQLGALVTTSLS